MKEDVLFKKTPFGGFDRVEVISYIQQLKITQQQYKQMLGDKENQIAKLNNEVSEREIQVEELRKQLKICEEKLAEAEKKLEELPEEKTEAEYAEETVAMCDELIETATGTAKKITDSAEEKLADAKKRIEKVVAKLESSDELTQKQLKTTLKKLIRELK